MLDVDHLSAPADKKEDEKPDLVLPVLRFPTWYLVQPANNRPFPYEG